MRQWRAKEAHRKDAVLAHAVPPLVARVASVAVLHVIQTVRFRERDHSALCQNALTFNSIGNRFRGEQKCL
jgi:hypothetical protein